MTETLFARAWESLQEPDAERKVERTVEAEALWRSGGLSLADDPPVRPIGAVGRPPRPRLVPPRELPRRSLGDTPGRAALVHAVTHIELNAINLAWDAVYRFRGLPPSYYGDWVQVAAEEAGHFRLLRERLRNLGFDYGDFPAHNGLWEAAERTAGDVLVRMALVPRVLEARGLDVTPGMIRRFESVGDRETADALRVILRDEVGHVAIGSRWFRRLCRERGLEPEATYFALLEHHPHGGVRGPLHREARLQGGFSESELRRLEALCARD